MIGRQGDNNLVLRDNRASRSHARIVAEGSDYFIEDLKSRHGVYVNGEDLVVDNSSIVRNTVTLSGAGSSHSGGGGI